MASGAWLLLGLLLVQAVLVFQFSRLLQRLRRPLPPVAEGGWPVLEVVLCLRGADACLPRLLSSLSQQSYPAPWHLQVVVDQASDPAWELLKPWISGQSAAWSTLRPSMLQDRPVQGSLKCAALRQALTRLDPSSALVVLLDADIRFPTDGLERCARSCLQPGVGAISGNRWFSPESRLFSAAALSSWTRAVWNAGAVVLMSLWKIPWGGTLCVRREVVEAGAWIALLQRGLCEDTGLLGPLRELGLAYRFEPRLWMVDPELAPPLWPLGRWITRQLLTARLHHPAWLLVALHGLTSAVLLLWVVLLGDWISALAYELGCLGLLCWVDRLVMPSARPQLWGWALGLVPGQVVDGFATLAAMFTRRIEWRGVYYGVRTRPSRVWIQRE